MKKLGVVMLGALCLTSSASAGFFGIQQSDLEALRIKAEEVEKRAYRMITNPLFLSAVACIVYAGPKKVAQEHPFFSMMGVGAVLAYLKGDFLVNVEGAEVSFRVLSKEERKKEKSEKKK